MHPLSPHPTPLITLAALALMTATGCEAKVGDPCVSNTQCGVGRICDTSSYEGYCTVSPCTSTSCPSDAVCVEFDDLSTYCMATCGGDEGCRDNYTCDTSTGPTPFCREGR
jgi:hypothetical protein